MKDDFRKKTLSGISWSFINQLFKQFFNIIISIILARLLAPNEFGVVGMITVFSGFAGLFLDTGFSGALIQKKDLTQADLSSVFWFNISIGAFLTTLFFLTSPAIAGFYNNPALEKISKVLSFQFIIGSFAIVQNTILSKSVNIKKQTLISLSAMLVGGGVSISMALNGMGYWSIVFQGLLSSIVSVTILWITSGWYPSLIFKIHALKGMLRFSSAMFTNQSLNYWSRNLDNMLIGKFLNSADLGLYTRAYAILLFPLNNISRIIGRVLFPSFSSIQDNIPRIRNAFIKITQIIAFITVPTAFGIFAVADKLVLVLFGEQWVDMIPLVKILCLLGASQSIFTIGGSIYHGLGRPDIPLRINILGTFLIVAGIVSGIYIGGIVEVAIGYALASLINLIPNVYFLSRMMGLSSKKFILIFLPQFFCSAIMCGLVIVVGNVLANSLTNIVILLTQVLVGVFSYFAINHFFNISAYNEVIRFLKKEYLTRKIANN